jgi:uncharacterized coiled-coil protein SlyX
MSEQRFITIETILAQQEKQIADLSEMVNLQRREIEVLQRKLEQTAARLKDIQAGAGDETANMSVSELAAFEKPPHY